MIGKNGNWLSAQQRIALEKRQATMAARKADQGCGCHHLPLLECPDFHPRLMPLKNGMGGMTWKQTKEVA